MRTKIENLLKSSLDIESLEILDESHKHAGHAGAKESGGGHFIVTIISKEFEGKNRIARHKMIYKALDSEIPHNIHALVIKAFTPKESK